MQIEEWDVEKMWNVKEADQPRHGRQQMTCLSIDYHINCNIVATCSARDVRPAANGR